jgi:hypothetical protein
MWRLTFISRLRDDDEVRRGLRMQLLLKMETDEGVDGGDDSGVADEGERGRGTLGRGPFYDDQSPEIRTTLLTK